MQGLDVSLLWLGANVLLIVLMILGSEIFYGCLVGENRNRNSQWFREHRNREPLYFELKTKVSTSDSPRNHSIEGLTGDFCRILRILDPEIFLGCS